MDDILRFACVLATILLAGCVSPLVKAAEKSDRVQAGRLLSAGADINAVSDGVTPLVAAATYARAEMIGFLLERGANPNLQPDGGLAGPDLTLPAINAARLAILLAVGAGHSACPTGGAGPQRAGSPRICYHDRRGRGRFITKNAAFSIE